VSSIDDQRELPTFNSAGLAPAIAQDADTGEVLMMAWMNQEAWEETLQTRRVAYYSRSRKALWRKGEQSGHVQELVEARVDCDADTILLKVRQAGAACHEGFRSCFFRRVADDGKWEVCETRLKSPDEIYGH